MKKSGAKSVAVSLLFSFLRPEHEKRLGEAFPGISVSLSHQVLPEFREYERGSTTVLDAYVKPLVSRYLQDLRDRLARIEQTQDDTKAAETAYKQAIDKEDE